MIATDTHTARFMCHTAPLPVSLTVSEISIRMKLQADGGQIGIQNWNLEQMPHNTLLAGCDARCNGCRPGLRGPPLAPLRSISISPK